MSSGTTPAVRWVIATCIAGACYALIATVQIAVFLSSGRLTTEVIYPPNLPKLFALLLLASLLTGSLLVAARQTSRSTSAQSLVASGWRSGSVLLWTMLCGWVLLVYYPIPYRAHHIDKVLLGMGGLLAWSLLYNLAPARLSVFLNSRAFHWFWVIFLNSLVFIMIGETVFRFADPWLAQRGPFGGKQTPSFMTPHALVEGSIRFSNSLGFRDLERTPDRKTLAPRIIAIGDSFTYGAGVSYDQAFVTLLEHGLKERNADVEILNMGVPGWGPHEELELLKSTAVNFKPDLVLLNVFVGNDIIPDGHFEPAMLVAGQRYVVHGSGNWIHDHLEPQRWFLYHHLHYLRTIGPRRLEQVLGPAAGKRVTWRRPVREACMLYWKADARSFESYWSQAREALEAIVRLLRSRRIDVILVLHPDVDQLYVPRLPCGRGTTIDQYDFERPQRLLREWAAMHDVPVVDLLPGFQQLPQPDLLYLVHQDDTHYNAEGHRLVAGTMLPVLYDWLARFSGHRV